MERKTKLRTYRLFKVNLCLEQYLLSSVLSYGRSLLTDIRTGTNQLEIEKGRWERKSEDRRICTHCILQQVENEIHFVIHCPKYANLRSDLFSRISLVSNNKWELNTMSVNNQFLFLVHGSRDKYEGAIF